MPNLLMPQNIIYLRVFILVREEKQGNSLIIEGVNLPSTRTELLVRKKLPEPLATQKCYLCSLGLDVKHTDVLILSQFVRSDGCMLPRRITGLCKRQQKKMGTMVSMAQKAGKKLFNNTYSHHKAS